MFAVSSDKNELLGAVPLIHPPPPPPLNIVQLCGTYYEALYLSRSYSMTLDIDDIIHSPGDLVVPCRIPQRPVAAEIETGVRAVIHVQELLVVAVNGACHAWPGVPDAEMAGDARTVLFFIL